MQKERREELIRKVQKDVENKFKRTQNKTVLQA